MLFKTLKSIMFISGVLVVGTAQSQNVAVVNGESIPSEFLDFIMEEQTKRGAPNTPEVRSGIRERIISQEVLKQEATRKGLGDNDRVQFQKKLANQAILAEALRKDFFENQTISDDELQSAYKEISKMMSGQEYKASHILVEEEDQAIELIKKLKDGEEFSKLAQENSIDPGSKTNGGDLGWANAQTFVPEFSNAMMTLEKGQYTNAPVKSEFGFHIIYLTDTRDVSPPPLEEVSEQLKENLIVRRWEEHVEKLVAEAKIK